jgi:Spy/CpxP family protein refolding chaperone
MSARIKALGVVFSVALNLAFLGAFAYHRAVGVESHTGPAAAAGPVFEQLELTPAQRQAFQAHREEFQRLLGRLGGELKLLQMELINLVSAPTPDRGAIVAKQKEIRRIQASIQSEVIDHLLAESALLSSEQRPRFFRLLRERMEGSAHILPPWAKPLEAGRAGEDGK